MGYIKLPKGVDLVVVPSKPTKADKEIISSYIEEYKSKSKARKRPVNVQGKAVRRNPSKSKA